MDSITQFVLGAAVSTVCLGKKIGPRKAALVGGALGTLPDLDVLIPFADPIDSFVYHRGWSHSLFVHALAAPVIGEGLVRLFKGLRDARIQTYLAVFLCLSTHAIIDAMTIYGTRLFWPFYPDPVGGDRSSSLIRSTVCPCWAWLSGPCLRRTGRNHLADP